MQVPQGLLDRRDELDRMCEAAIQAAHEAEAERDVLCAEYKGLVNAIAIIEGAEDRLEYVPVSSTKAFQPVLKREPYERFPATPASSQRRNIKQLVADYLRERPSHYTVQQIATDLGAQTSSVKGALYKLHKERSAHNRDGAWEWIGGKDAAADRSAISGDDDGGSEAEAEPPASKFVAAEIVEFLEGRPEGMSIEDLARFGLREQIEPAVERGDVWQDPRGFYHASVGLQPDAGRAAE